MSRPRFEPAHDTYRRIVQNGALVTGASQCLITLSQFVSVVVLSRLLSPVDFGIAAMSWPVIGLLSVFQDFGLTQATVQRKLITQSDINFLFWMNVGVSSAAAAIVFAVAPVAAWFYQEPSVRPLLQALSCLVLIQGIGAQHIALLNRLMQFNMLAAVEVTGALSGLAVSIAWAVLHPSYWALFGGSLATVLTSALLAWRFSEWRPGLPRSTAEASGLLRFGLGMTGFNFANFIARNGDNILIGKYLGNVPLGLYDRAYKLLLMPLRQVTNPLARVMIPTLSRLNDSPERYRRAYLTTIPILLLAILPGVAALIVVAKNFIPFLLGEKWRESAFIFSALGFAGLLQPLNSPAGWLFISQGRTREFMVWGIASAATSVAAFAIGLPFGAVGVATAYAASEYLRTPLLWWYVGRKGAVRMRDVFSHAGPIVLGAHISLLVLWLVQHALSNHPLLQAISAGLISYVLTMLVALLFPTGRTLLKSLLGLARSKP